MSAHTAALKSIGISDDEIRTIEQDLARADFSAKEKALIDFARRANLILNSYRKDIFIQKRIER